MKGNTIIRLGMAILFIWGGLEKFVEGFLGGVGLDNMAAFLKQCGMGFLGDTGTFILGAVIAAVELLAGILLVVNQKTFYAYGVLAIIMFVALTSAHIPSGNWMNIMIHIALFTTLAGLAIENKDDK